VLRTCSRRLGGLLLAVLFACGDDASPYRVEVNFASAELGDAATVVEVAFVSECPPTDRLGEDPVGSAASLVLVRGAATPALKAPPSGAYGMHARARRRGDCMVIAAGCAPVKISAGGGKTLRVTLSEVPNGLACSEGVACEASTGECAGTCDGGNCELRCDGGECAEAGDDAEVSCPFGYEREAASAECVPGVGDEAIDESGNVGLRNDLILDAEGRPHVAYFALTSISIGSQVRYSTKGDAGWLADPQLLGNDPNTGALGQGLGMALSAAGDPLVAFTEADGKIRFSTRTDGTWDPPNGSATGVTLVPEVARFAVQESAPGSVSIAWGSGYVNRQDGVWTPSAFTAPGAGFTPTVVFTAPGKNLAWLRVVGAAAPYSLVVGEWDGVSAENGPAAAAPPINSLKADLAHSDGLLDVVYATSGLPENTVTHVRGRGDTWSAPAMIGELDGDPIDVAVARNGDRVAVAFTDDGPQSFRLVTKDGDAPWSEPRVLVQNDAGQGAIDLAVDDEGGIHGVYYDSGKADLRYLYVPEAF
jgi:hypothetical protein